MDPDGMGPVIVLLDGQSVIQVFGSSRVDREDPVKSKVLADLEFALRNTAGSAKQCKTRAEEVIHDHGNGGRHLTACSGNSSVGKLQSLSRALVSTSAFPIGPNSSTSVPKGWRLVL
jgi:hypothetical protein